MLKLNGSPSNLARKKIVHELEKEILYPKQQFLSASTMLKYDFIPQQMITSKEDITFVTQF